MRGFFVIDGVIRFLYHVGLTNTLKDYRLLPCKEHNQRKYYFCFTLEKHLAIIPNSSD